MRRSRVAVVTGAGRGIGAALVGALAADGVAVGLVGRDQARLTAVAAGCARAVVAVADVTDSAQVRAAVSHIGEELGQIDLLVNNAGRIDAEETPFGESDLEAIWSVMEVNVRGPLTVARVVLPSMLAAGGGRIVTLNSSLAYRSTPAYTGYAISKAAASRLTQLLAHQYAGQGIRAFDISPGAVATDMTLGLPKFAGKTDWLPMSDLVSFVLAVTHGSLDELHGRFFHAGLDDVESLLGQADLIRARDARVLGLRDYGPSDPLGSPPTP